MKKAVFILLLSTTPLAAQTTAAPISLSMEERQAVLQMCEVARWASRIQFDQTCEILKARFAEADKTEEKKK